MKKNLLKWMFIKFFLELICLLAIIACVAMYFFTWAHHGNLVGAVFYFLLALVLVYIFLRIRNEYHFKGEVRN